jgi:hypothetical protein
MSNIFRHTIYVSVLACAALLTACHSSSDKGQPSKVERTEAPATSAASEPRTHHRSVASTKATHAQPAAQAKASTDTKPNAAPSPSNPFTNP